MNLTRLAIENNRVTFVALVVTLIAGVGTYVRMPRSEDPGFIVRTAVVTTVFPGAGPERVERLVTDRLEKVIQEMPELDFVKSESKTGLSLVFVNIQERYTDLRPIWDDLRRKVAKAAPELPDGVIGPTVNDEFGDVYGIIISLTGGEEFGDGGGVDFEYRELKQIADEVRDELLLIDDVAKVEVYGAQEERIFVEYNNSRLAELGLSPLQLQQILETRNIIIPGGEIRTEFESIVLEPSGNFESLDELRHTVIQVPGRREVIFLRDVAGIRTGYIDPPRTKMRSSGTRSLGLALSMRDGGNIISVGRQVRTTLEQVQTRYPIGIDFDVIQFQPDSVQNLIRGFVSNLLQAVGLVAAIMLLSLGLRTGLVVASLIPMSIVAAIAVMGVFDIGLDQLSIASLIIALGMLVDNAIVISESIQVQMAEGKAALDAAIDSATELKWPLLTSSLTTAAAFLPIYLAESSTGEYTAPLFKVVTITLLCSWLLSLTMIPLLCVRFLRVNRRAGGDAYDTAFYRRYRNTLLALLRRPWISLAAVGLLFVAALAGLRLVPVIFFPANDRPCFTAELDLPAGTPLARTEAIVTRVEEFIRRELLVTPERPEGVVNWASFIGQGAPRFVVAYEPEQIRSGYAMLLINATSRAVIDEMIPRIDAFCRSNDPDLQSTVRPLSLGPPAWPPIQVRISGRDPAQLFDIVERVEARLREIPGAWQVADDWGARSKKLAVRVNQPRARRAGVTSRDVAISLQTFLSGMEATEFRQDNDLIPITLRSVAAERQDIGKLESLNVYAQASGRSVPLKQIADVEVMWQPSNIKRYDRLKTATVEANLAPGVTADRINDTLRSWLERDDDGWPAGYTWTLGGEAETSGEANASIVAKLPIAALIIGLLLVGQFNSIRRPAIIVLTIPLSLIGVVIGLIVLRSYFGFMTLLGIISLAGIVINNAIVLLDRIRIEIEHNGRSPARAVVESAQRRLRPIVLTTCTTIGGLIPLYLGGGPMWEPMAVAIMFGLLFGTALTLGVVPLLYALFFRVRFEEFVYSAT